MSEMDFWFDFGSPYGYLMAERIDELATRHGRTVHWRPVLLFAVLRQLGVSPSALAHEVKRDYLLLDVVRSARHMGLPYRPPSRFPVMSPLPARLFYVLAERDAAVAVAFARAALRAAFCDDQPLDDADAVSMLAVRFDGRDAQTLRAAADGEVGRAMLARAIEKAVEQRVFGSPFVQIDGEPFFGADHLPQIEARLAVSP